jgi:two-component sensor histidine kinase
VRLVVSELATNVLVHAHTPFGVTLVGDDDHLVVLTVRDDSTSLPARRTAQATDAGGRGLQLVDTLSTHWGVNTDGAGSKAVWASFAIT